MRNKIKTALLILFILAALYYLFFRRPAPSPVVGSVTTTDTLVIYRDLPAPKPKIIERVKWREVDPQIVVKTDTVRDTVSVAAYCDSSRTRAVLPSLRLAFDGTSLKFQSVLSDGRLYRSDTKTTVPFQALTHDSTFEVRQERLMFHGLRGLSRCAVSALGGGAIGALAGGSSWKRTGLTGAAAACVASIAF